MSFRAKRLRVQLPCTTEGSLVPNDQPAPGGGVPGGVLPTGPVIAPSWAGTCMLSWLDYCHCSIEIMLCDVSTDTPCIDSALASAPAPAEPVRQVGADVLPLLKQQLEHRLAELDLVAALAKSHIQGRLDEIAEAEQALREAPPADE